MDQNKLYLPGLNDIRAVAAITVLFGHMWAPFGNWGATPPWNIPWPDGPVTTFFVISGFLITYLLMNEIGKTNDVASVVIFITMTILTIVLAGLSYKFFEMPFLRLKSKFSVVQSTNSKE